MLFFKDYLQMLIFISNEMSGKTNLVPTGSALGFVVQVQDSAPSGLLTGPGHARQRINFPPVFRALFNCFFCYKISRLSNDSIRIENSIFLGVFFAEFRKTVFLNDSLGTGTFMGNLF